MILQLSERLLTIKDENELMDEDKKRPAYQQNDYTGWINNAKRQETKEKRVAQMIDELEASGTYMKMKHP